MSAIKNLLYDYMAARELTDFEALSSQDYFKFKTKFLTSATPIPPLAIEFFNSVIPNHDRFNRWIMLIGKEKSASYGYSNTADFLNGYSMYAPLTVNTFFSPCLYDGWYNAANARFCKTIFLDIDGITDTNLLSMTTPELSDWINRTYNVPEHLLPDWCICTGHGLHLYFIVDEIDFTNNEQSRLRDYYTQMLICYFHGDFTCRNRNHILRLPFSNNCKQQNTIQTRLHKLHSESDTNISRLDYFYRSDTDIEAYRQECYIEIKEKAARTRKEHQDQKAAVAHETANITPKREERTLPDKISDDFCVPIETMKYFDDFRRNSRYWNIIKDLHNFYLRHNGNIIGHRNVFIHIMATFLKSAKMPADEAVDFIEPYCTRNFLAEAQRTVNAIYKSSTIYRYNNDSIGLLLGFTEEDYRLSYCCYNKATRYKRKKEANNRAKAKQYRESRQQRKTFKTDLFHFVEENPDLSCKDIGIIYGVSTRTIQRIRKDLRGE